MWLGGCQVWCHLHVTPLGTPLLWHRLALPREGTIYLNTPNHPISVTLNSIYLNAGYHHISEIFLNISTGNELNSDLLHKYTLLYDRLQKQIIELDTIIEI